MRYVHVIALGIVAGVVAQAELLIEGLDTVAMLHIVEHALPHSVEIAPPLLGYTRDRGHLGNIAHFYVNLVDASIKRLRINNRADAYLVFLPGSYRYPNEQVWKKYHPSLVATNTRFHVYLLAPESQGGIWQRCRNELRNAFSAQGLLENSIHASSLTAPDGPRLSGAKQSDIIVDFTKLQELQHPSLDSVIIPQVDFLQADLNEVVAFLNQASREYASPRRPTLNIRLMADVSSDNVRISLAMVNASLRVILDSIGKQAGLVYSINKHSGGLDILEMNFRRPAGIGNGSVDGTD